MRKKFLQKSALSIFALAVSFARIEASAGHDYNNENEDVGNNEVVVRKSGCSAKNILDIQWCIQRLQDAPSKTIPETLKKIYFVLLFAQKIDGESAMELLDALPQAYKCISYFKRYEASKYVQQIGRIVSSKVENAKDKYIANQKCDKLLWVILRSRMVSPQIPRKNLPKVHRANVRGEK